jgi:ATP-dependent Lhr-like helicase
VLRLIRRRCLARLRKEAEPVPPEVLAAFLPGWQHAGRPDWPARHSGVAATGGRAGARAGPGVRAGPDAGAWQVPGRAAGRPGRWRLAAEAGPDAVYDAVAQLAGAPVPASALESLMLPGRVPGYQPAVLDELTAAGEVVWAGAGGLPGGDGWVVLAPAHLAPLLLPPPAEITMTAVHEAVAEALDGAGGLFFRMLSDRVAALLAAGGQPPPTDAGVAAAIWDLVWAGRLTNDTLAPLRTVLATGGTGLAGGAGAGTAGPLGRAAAAGGGDGVGRAGGPDTGSVIPPRITARPAPASRAAARRRGYGRPLMPTRTGPPTVSGRWSLLPEREADPTRRLHAAAQTMLDRHGILTRGAVAAERLAGGFGALYPVLRAMEEAGHCRRGYFVEGLGAAQFALPGAVDRMRALGDAGSASDQRLPREAGPRRIAEAPGGPGARADTVVLAAADPANAFGSALPWPERPGEVPGAHRPGRKAGALVILCRGRLVLYVERGGKSLLSWTSDPAELIPAAAALAGAVRGGALGRLTVERADGSTIYDTPLGHALAEAGFRSTPRGLRLRG